MIGNLFSGATRAVTSLLNLTTYYEMKKRAGTPSLGDAINAIDEFGGTGSNGAQRMENGEVAIEINEMLPTGQPYAWQAGKFHKLESGEFIVDPKGGDAHGFVYVPQVAWALSRVIMS